jgi:hypothetical protein
MGKNYVEKQMKKLLIEEQEKLEREVQDAVRNKLKKGTTD